MDPALIVIFGSIIVIAIIVRIFVVPRLNAIMQDKNKFNATMKSLASASKSKTLKKAVSEAIYKTEPERLVKIKDLRDPKAESDRFVCFPTIGPDGNALVFDKQCDASKLAKHGLPAIGTIEEMAQMMGVAAGELRWLMSDDGNHYSRVGIKGRNGKARLLFPPKTKMKACQRWILRNVLNKIQPHGATEGFRKGRSIVTHAANHSNKDVVYAMDIYRFFDTVKSKQVYGVFRRVGYSEEAALAFSLLTTRRGRLPQGSPTSPALANLVCHRMDARLTGLAKKFNATYSRYADDMAFSGPATLSNDWPKFRFVVRKIIEETGFRINDHKTKTMKSVSRQKVTGIVVNKGPKIPRKELRKLKAIIHNASKTGLDAQNRRNHKSFGEYLKGRISFVHMMQPEKAAKLRAAFDKIA